MNRRWLLIAAAIAVVAVLGILSGGKVDSTALARTFGLKVNADQRTARTKPICSQVIVPAGDCIPQHLADLPPDPGPEGMKTLAGIDSDNDGVRDDVQRYIALNYGHSERAVMSLREIAKGAQRQIMIANTINGGEAKQIAEEIMKRVDCFSRSVDKEIVYSGAVEKVITEVTNTPERYARKGKFEVLAANRVYELSNESTPALCGYDPAKLPN